MKTFDPEWTKVHAEKAWGTYPSEEVVRFTARNYFKQQRNSVNILDLGCGTGANSWFLAREGFNLVAFDGAYNAVAKAQNYLASQKLSAKFCQADAGALPFQSEYFDSIIDSAAICSNTSQGIARILKECNRILKPNGKIFSSGLFKIGMTGYQTGEQIDEFSFRNIPEGPVAGIGTVHFFSVEEINKLWTEAGFCNLIIDSIERTDRGGSSTVSYFMVQATKA